MEMTPRGSKKASIPAPAQPLISSVAFQQMALPSLSVRVHKMGTSHAESYTLETALGTWNVQ